MAHGNEHPTVYAVIYSNLRSQIFSGKYPPGALLPSESQLCAEFNASRETVRKGLKALENEGLVFSRPKVGYFVSTPNHSDITLSLTEELKDCTTFYKDIHGVMPDQRIQQILEIPANRKVIEFSQITLDPGGSPVAFDVKYVPYERAYPSVESEIRFAVLPDITSSKMSSYAFYTEITVNAVGASPSVAQALNCPEGEPLLLIERVFIQQDGKRIGYLMHYCRQPFGRLKGTAGHRL